MSQTKLFVHIEEAAHYLSSVSMVSSKLIDVSVYLSADYRDLEGFQRTILQNTRYMPQRHVHLLIHENNITIFDVHIFNINNLIISGRRYLMNRALRFLYPFNNYSFPTVGVVNPDHRRSSLLNSHKVVIKSIRKRPNRLLVFRYF